MSTTKLRRRLHIVCSIDRSIYGSAFSATTKIKDLKKTKKERQPMRLRMRMTTMMMRIMMRMVNGSSRWPFSTAFKDCTLMAPRTLFLPLPLSRSSLLCSSLTLSPSPRSHYFGIVFVTASYDAIIDLSKKQNTLCQKKTKNWPQDFKGKIPTHTHTGDSLGQRSAANLVTRIDVH